jgi:hypothetical protein
MGFNMFRFWDKKIMTEAQYQQYKVLIAAYCKAFGKKPEELPECLVVEQVKQDQVKTKRQYDIIDLNADRWELGDASLATGSVGAVTREILRLICSYQEERFCRRHSAISGYLDEPIQMVCHFMKEFLKEVSGAQPSTELLSRLETGLLFINDILADPCFLPEFDACKEAPESVLLPKGSRSFHYVCLLIREGLQKLKLMLEGHLAKNSSRDRFLQLVGAPRSAVEYLIQYLFAILNTQDIPSNCDITTMQAIQKGDSYLSSTLQPNEILRWLCIVIKFSQSATKENDMANPFYTQDTHQVCLPFKEEAEVRRAFTLADFGQKNPGIPDYFLKNESLLRSFLGLHGLSIELLKLSNAWEEAYQLAGTGGDIASYGLAHDTTAQLIDASEKLIHKTKETTIAIEEILKGYYLSMAKLNAKVDEEWRQNYLRAINYYGKNLERKLQTCLDAIAAVRTDLNQLSLKQRMQKLQTELTAFRTKANSVTEKIYHILGMPVPPTVKKIQLTKYVPVTDQLIVQAIQEGGSQQEAAAAAQKPAAGAAILATLSNVFHSGSGLAVNAGDMSAVPKLHRTTTVVDSKIAAVGMHADTVTLGLNATVATESTPLLPK